MLVLGVGIGMVMQVLVIAVQNAVEYRDLGVATSGATLFRLVGGSLGTALLGAVFSARLSSSRVKMAYLQAFATSLDTVFVIAAVVAVVGFVLTLFLPERPLRRTIAATAGEAGDEVAGTFGQPVATESDSELARGLAILANRDVQRAHIAQIVARAGLSLSPGAAWLLVRIEREPELNLAQLGEQYRIPLDRVAAMEHELETTGLIERVTSEDVARWRLTPGGCDALNHLIEARRAHLADLIAEWPIEQREGLAQHLRAIAEALVPTVPRPDTA
jgi:DNA-binding MarR family transcriptional regulator